MQSKLLLIIGCFISLSIKSETIVLLRGTACAGKTSFTNAINCYEGWGRIEEDEYFYTEQPKMWRQLFPEEYEIICKVIAPENRLHAILWGNPLYSDTATAEQKQQAHVAIEKIRQLSDYPEIKDLHGLSKYIENIYHQDLTTILERGNNIIIDAVWKPLSYFDRYKQNGHIIKTIVGYCNLHEAFRRLEKRNYHATIDKNNQNRRYVRHLLCSFYTDFRPADVDDITIDHISREQMNNIFDIALSMINKHTFIFTNYGLFSRCELTIEAFQALKQNIWKKFELDKYPEVAITYAYPFDAAIRLDGDNSVNSFFEVLGTFALNSSSCENEVKLQS